MENLLQNEFNQIAFMHALSQDELEQIAKIRRIRNCEDMKKEDLIIALLTSKESIAELFNDNNNNEISDIRRILYKIEHQRNISEAAIEENDEYLRKLLRIPNNKEKIWSW